MLRSDQLAELMAETEAEGYRIGVLGRHRIAAEAEAMRTTADNSSAEPSSVRNPTPSTDLDHQSPFSPVRKSDVAQHPLRGATGVPKLPTALKTTRSGSVLFSSLTPPAVQAAAKNKVCSADTRRHFKNDAVAEQHQAKRPAVSASEPSSALSALEEITRMLQAGSESDEDITESTEHQVSDFPNKLPGQTAKGSKHARHPCETNRRRPARGGALQQMREYLSKRQQQPASESELTEQLLAEATALEQEIRSFNPLN